MVQVCPKEGYARICFPFFKKNICFPLKKKLYASLSNKKQLFERICFPSKKKKKKTLQRIYFPVKQKIGRGNVLPYPCQGLEMTICWSLQLLVINVHLFQGLKLQKIVIFWLLHGCLFVYYNINSWICSR